MTGFFFPTKLNSVPSLSLFAFNEPFGFVMSRKACWWFWENSLHCLWGLDAAAAVGGWKRSCQNPGWYL